MIKFVGYAITCDDEFGGYYNRYLKEFFWDVSGALFFDDEQSAWRRARRFGQGVAGIVAVEFDDENKKFLTKTVPRPRAAKPGSWVIRVNLGKNFRDPHWVQSSGSKQTKLTIVEEEAKGYKRKDMAEAIAAKLNAGVSAEIFQIPTGEPLTPG